MVPRGLLTWWSVIGSIVIVCVVVGFLVVVVLSGPRAGWRWVNEAFANIVVDLARISPRRVWALTWLAFWESMRRRVIVVFAIFVLLLLVAGWYLDPGSDEAGRALLIDRVHGHRLSRGPPGLVLKRFQPAGGHQQPHAPHRGHQAGASQRDCPGADGRIHPGGDRAVGGDERRQFPLRRAEPGTHPRSPRGQPAAGGDRQGRASPGPGRENGGFPEPLAPRGHRSVRQGARGPAVQPLAHVGKGDQSGRQDVLRRGRDGRHAPGPGARSTASSAFAILPAWTRQEGSTSATNGLTAASFTR